MLKLKQSYQKLRHSKNNQHTSIISISRSVFLLGGESMTKTIIIGANHSGIAAANTILDNDPNHEVVMIDRSDCISYLGTGSALWIGRQIDSYESLFYTSGADFEKKGAKVYLKTEVNHIDFESKKVICFSHERGQFDEFYDQLIIGTGSKPIALNVPGNELANIHYLKTFQEAKLIDQLLDQEDVKTVAVIGAGYIGIEIAEAAKLRNKKVLLFDVAKRSVPAYFDEWITTDMDKALQDNGVELHFNEEVKSIQGVTKVEGITTNQGTYQVDLVINAIGFMPNTSLAKNQLETYRNEAYLVDSYQRTSEPDVYAIGDCGTVFSNALNKQTYIALATNAVRTGIVAGLNVAGIKTKSNGVQGSNGISIFGLNMVSTGVSVESALKNKMVVDYTDFEDLQKPAFMKKNDLVKIRIAFEKNSRRVVGAQLSSYEDMSSVIHMFSLAIEKQVTIDELKLLDIFFLPHFNQPYNYITMASLGAK